MFQAQPSIYLPLHINLTVINCRVFAAIEVQSHTDMEIIGKNLFDNMLLCCQCVLQELVNNILSECDMSFFAKLFGGDDKKDQAPPPPPPKSEVEKMDEKRLKMEAAINDLDTKIKAFEEKEKKYDYKIELLKNKAKELIAADKKKQAKKYVEEATKVQKQAEGFTLRKKVLVDKKFQLDQAMMDMETIGALDNVGEHLKEQEKYSDKMQDIILDGQEAKMRQKEIDDKMKDMLDNDSDEQDVDAMFNDLMKEVNTKKAQDVAKKNVNVNPIGVPAAKQKNEKDEIEDMLANL